MKKIYLLLTFILMTSCSNSTKAVFLGDSITMAGVYDTEVGVQSGDTLIYPKYSGFITLLKNDIEDDIELIGKGVSGDKVSNLLERYKEDVLSLNPDIVFIYIGINDVWHKYDFGTGTDILFYENGLRKIIADIKSNGARVVLCTPTVIGENKGELRGIIITDFFQFILAMVATFWAAYEIVNLPQVAGLTNLLNHPDVVPKLNLIPDIADTDLFIAVN